MGRLPEGTVTFLFSDIAGSTRLLQELGEGYADLLLDHRARLREVFARNNGVEVDTAGDSFFVAFHEAADAACAAVAAQEVLRDSRISVRIGLHTGEPMIAGDGYVGIDVHRAARISSVVHGGQVVVSERTRTLLADDAEVTDLGQHRLKDLVAPEHLFQLGPGGFPPLRSLNATNLPDQASPLIGRKREIGEVAQLLAQRRVVTLTGPGGTGKTRLAIQTAVEGIDRFPDGVFWVPLAAIDDPDLVPTAIADSIGTDRPPHEHIDGKLLLAVLDNLEQVLDAAPYLSSLVENCPDLRLLVTSRAPLRIAGEVEYAVEPLPVADAMELFQERAFEAGSPEVVAEICRRVDRLPLAVELAAARTRLFSPVQLLERLTHRLTMLSDGRRDAPQRHRALRATIEWSYDLLEPESQGLFAQLGVFVGSFDLEAAAAVAGATVDRLASLVESSLVRRIDDRFTMLETIREYAVERLDASPATEDVQDRHLRYFLDLTEQGAANVEAGNVGTWLMHIGLDEDNIRAAIGRAVDCGAAEEALRFCGAMGEVWLSRFRIVEGLGWIDRALAAGGPVAPQVRARALAISGSLLHFANRTPESVERLEECVAIWRGLGESHEGLAEGLLRLGAALSGLDPHRARVTLGEALEVSRRSGHRTGESRVLHLLGEILRDEGEYGGAAGLLERSIEISAGNQWLVRLGATLHSLGDLELDRGRLEEARERYRESLRGAVDAGIDRHEVYCLAGLAAVAARRGDHGLAARLWSAVELAETQLGVRLLTQERDRYERCLDGVPRWAGEPLDLEAAVEFALGDELNEPPA